MKQAIRLLQVEDSEDDAALVVRLLEGSGYAIDTERIVDAEQMRTALEKGGFDLIISDYRLPQFSAPAALSLFRETDLDIPFIVVSGAVGEDTAVSIMKAGAHDFLLKDRMDRLLPAVKRELNEAKIRQQKRETDQKLRAAHTELETIYANAPVQMFVADGELRVEKINELAASFCGLSTDDCREKKICELLRCPHPAPISIDAAPAAICAQCPIWTMLADVFRTGAPHQSVEVWSPLMCEEKTGASCLLVSAAPIVVGKASRVLITAQDVTRLKTVETSLQESIHSLKAALSEKVVLFQEIHHRVKNNLQIIASLLSIKARKDPELICAEDLKECERRVKSMALIHEQLYSQNDVTRVELDEYIKKIVPEIVASFEREDSLSLRMEISPTTCSIDQSIPCGLIVNELITNAIKYAYPDGRGELLIGLCSDGGMVRLTVADRGVGMPLAPPRKGSSLGMKIIEMLAKKLKGTVEFKTNQGTTATLSFPKD